METLFHILDARMTTPTSYGIFHFAFIFAVIIATVLLCKFFKDCDYKTFKKIFLIGWAVIIVLEIYKEFIIGSSFKDGVFSYGYPWYAFPFQFCSTPFYVFPFVAFMKKNRFSYACAAFAAVYSLAAGIMVYAYPEQVFLSIIGINVQSLIHHGTQIVLGIFTLVYFRRELNKKFFIASSAVFLGFVAVATALNEIFYYFIVPESETFNMFFISSHYHSTLPVASLIYGKVPFPVFLLLYCMGFILLGLIVFMICKLVIMPFTKKEEKKIKA